MASDSSKRVVEGGLPRRPAGVLVQYRGGSSAFFELSYGGRKVRVDGGMALIDAMASLFGAVEPNDERRR